MKYAELKPGTLFFDSNSQPVVCKRVIRHAVINAAGKETPCVVVFTECNQGLIFDISDEVNFNGDWKD